MAYKSNLVIKYEPKLLFEHAINQVAQYITRLAILLSGI